LVQKTVLSSYKKLGGGLHKSLLEESIYPWELLAKLSPEKFFSDLIKSILGAIFADAKGDLVPCQKFIDGIGFTPP
jgi:dsRNA-specific ribonuclease